MMGAPKEHCGVERCYRATTRESVNDCFPTSVEMERYAGRRGIAEESDEKRKTAR